MNAAVVLLGLCSGGFVLAHVGAGGSVDHDTALLAEVTPWWSGATAAWIGGVGGSVIGLCGALLGVLAGTGRGRRLVLVFVPVMIVLGIAAAAAGVIALTLGQPYAVYYPLLLGGGIVAFVFGFNYPFVIQRYRQLEFRKMHAADVE